MPTATFDELLAEADATARAAQWRETFETLSRASQLQPRHAGVITGLGTCLLQLGQPQAALSYFQQTVQLEPDSPEAYNNLGVAYLLTGEPGQAETACRQALAKDADHLPAWRTLALACLRQGRLQDGVSMLAAIVRAHPDDVEALLQLARCYADGGQPASARFLYQHVLQLQPAHPEALAGLATLAPAPAAPTVTPPAPAVAPAAASLSRLARPEHASKLARLRAIPASPAQPSGAGGPSTPAAAAARPAIDAAPAPLPTDRQLSVAFYGAAEVSLGVRVGVPAAGLRQKGHHVTIAPASTQAILADCRHHVFLRPQLSPEIYGLMEQGRRSGARVIVDLDDDFHQIPADHPGYNFVGPGNPANLQLLDRAIAGADLLVVASPTLAERYRPQARQVTVLPNGWDDSNPLWNKPGPRHATLNLGWAGTLTHRADFALIRPVLIRLAREFPQVQIVIGGDPEIYETLSALPERQRLFLPMVSFEDYPYLLAHFDVLLAPLRNNPFNQAKSDIKLLEAGIRRIPWVATPIPAYQSWNAGGILAEKPDQWFTALRQLVTDAAQRQSLGAAGRALAETRESRQLAAAWETALGQ